MISDPRESGQVCYGQVVFHCESMDCNSQKSQEWDYLQVLVWSSRAASPISIRIIPTGLS